MKKNLVQFFLLSFLFLIPMSLFSQPSSKDTSKSLIVYFSRVGSSHSFQGVDAVASASLPQGNTIILANMIHKYTGGDMFQIVTVNPYPSKYRDTTDQALKEQNENARPKLSTHIKDIGAYNVIFLGYPDWWGTLPMPLFSFLEEYNLSGKTIIPFCTHEGSGFGSSVNDLSKLAPKAKLLEGFSVRGSNVKSAEQDVQNWLKRIGFN